MEAWFVKSFSLISLNYKNEEIFMRTHILKDYAEVVNASNLNCKLQGLVQYAPTVLTEQVETSDPDEFYLLFEGFELDDSDIMFL
jgi:hypothetical protein